MERAGASAGTTSGPEGPEAAGALLRRAREQRGLSIDECATRIRARSIQIEALERGAFEAFGGAVYARGFLRSYAVTVGVDPDEVLRLHGDDPAFRPPTLPSDAPLRLRRDPPGWLVGLVGMVVLAGVVLVVLGVGGRRVPEPAVDADTPVAVPDVSAPAATAPEPDAPVEQPAVAELGPPVDVIVTFEADSWLEVLVDDVPARPSAVVAAGETLRFGGQSNVSLRLGNAGGVRVELNGADLGAPGADGAVVTLVLGPDGPVEVLEDGDG